MASTDPVARLASTYRLDDLREVVGRPGPFLTVVLPSPSELDDARHRREVQWRNARRGVESEWPAELLDALETAVLELPHDGGEALVAVQDAQGTRTLEFLDHGVDRAHWSVGALPRLAAIIENRQRTLPHIVVMTDRTGADITAFDAGEVVAARAVEGETEHIHRGHPGGWSQRRFQQRAENTWERNADDVADAIGELARHVRPVLIAVAGEVRARSLVLDALSPSTADRIEGLESGDADHAADEVLRLLADLHARAQRDALERLASALARGAATGTDGTLHALNEGRVGALLVADHGDEQPVTGPHHATPGARVVDVAVAGALRGGATITIVPRAQPMDGPVAALLRW
jgi:hypothetical protein